MSPQVSDVLPVLAIVAVSLMALVGYQVVRRSWLRWATAALLLGAGFPLALDAMAVRPSWPAYLGAAMVGLGLVLLAYATSEHPRS